MTNILIMSPMLPSVEEGRALVQAQARACGGRVVGTPHTGAEDLFSAGLEGFIVPIRSTEAIAEKLQLLADDPEDPGLRFLQATLNAAEGDLAAAERQYRGLIEQGAGGERVWLELIRTLNRAGETEEANEALEAGLSAIPQAPDLMWMRATFLERQHDFEAAIEIYEDLYERNTATSVIANNLASLLSTQREDAESLDRAARIARRLRGTEFPPYQDTYGWIQFRLGNYETALEYLRPAALGLPDDPLVQYHLGRTYAALDRPEEAIRQLDRALEIAGPDPREAFQIAREMLQELQNRDSGSVSEADALDALPSTSPGVVAE